MELRGWKFGLLLLWLAGAALRLTVLSVPPLLGQIHHQLKLTGTEVGVLTGLPVLLLALAAVPGSLLVARLGARRALLIGLVVVALAGAARGLSSSTWLLFSMTLLMGCGVAVSQPSLPSLVKAWLPDLIGLGTATFSNGLLIGEILPVAITVPLLLPVTGSWQGAIALWSAPVAFTALLIRFLTPRDQTAPGAVPARWWPDWSEPKVWLLGLVLGGASVSYWGANSFIPDYLRSQHHAALITPVLTSLNLIQLPASILVAVMPDRLIGHWWPISMAGTVTLLTAAGLVILPARLMILDAGLLGFSTAMVFVLALALPPLLAEAGDTHRLSAGMFTISYVCPFLGSLLGGALWDLSGVAAFAFVPLFIGGLLMLLLPHKLDMSSAQRPVASQVSI